MAMELGDYEHPHPLNIDGLIYALELVDDSEALDDYLFSTVPAHFPDRLVELYTRLVAHPDIRLRDSAAVGIHRVIEIDEVAGLQLAQRLLEDESADVAERVQETAKAAAEEDELPNATLVKFDNLVRDALAKRPR